MYTASMQIVNKGGRKSCQKKAHWLFFEQYR